MTKTTAEHDINGVRSLSPTPPRPPSFWAVYWRSAVALGAALLAARLMWGMWPDVVAAFGGAEHVVQVLAVLLIGSSIYRIVKRRLSPSSWDVHYSSGVDQWPTGAAHVRGSDTPEAGGFRLRLTEKALTDEFGDELLVANALARAQDPTDRAEVTALIESLRRRDARTTPTVTVPVDRTRRTARHEAAHAVISLATGGSIREAAVRA